MNCQAVRTFLDAYSTDELDLIGATEIDAHLAECQGARTTWRS
jgi:predicted anti-sigma-YlaC factor YlaD